MKEKGDASNNITQEKISTTLDYATTSELNNTCFKNSPSSLELRYDCNNIKSKNYLKTNQYLFKCVYISL